MTIIEALTVVAKRRPDLFKMEKVFSTCYVFSFVEDAYDVEQFFIGPDEVGLSQDLLDRIANRIGWWIEVGRLKPNFTDNSFVDKKYWAFYAESYPLSVSSGYIYTTKIDAASEAFIALIQKQYAGEY